MLNALFVQVDNTLSIDYAEPSCSLRILKLAGLAGSGTVNIVTGSGGNAVHGEGYFFSRSANGATRVDRQKFPFERGQTGFNLGGPFCHDRFFWFISYEQSIQDSANATQVPESPRYPGTWPIHYDERLAVARLDWIPTSKWRPVSRRRRFR